MATYTLHFEMDQKVIDLDSKDNLCIARKVNDTFNVVLHNASLYPIGHQQKLLLKNTFTWSDKFRVFCVEKSTPSVAVSAATNWRDIGYGEESLYEKSSLQDPKVAPLDKFPNRDKGKNSAQDSFIISQVPSTLRAACDCFTVGERWDPIYVDPNAHFSTRDQVITISNEYLIFWDSQLTPNAMFRYFLTVDKKTFAFPPKTFEFRLRFGFAEPDRPSANEQPQFWKAQDGPEDENDQAPLRWTPL